MQKDAFKTLKILHLAIAGSLFLCILLLVIIHGKTGAADNHDSMPGLEETRGILVPDQERILQSVAVVLSVAMLLTGFNLFKRKILAARNRQEKGAYRMGMYRMACIAWWAMIEGPGLFAAISFYISGNYAFVALAGFHLLLLLLFMPRKENIIVLLNLNSQEVTVLEGKR